MAHATFDSQTLGRRVHELLILAALERAPMHGYEIALRIGERSGGYFPFSHGTLYPILHRLEQEGHLAGEWTDPEAGRPRKQYVLTEAGRTYLSGLRSSWRRLESELDRFLGAGGEETDEQVRTGAA